MMKLASVRVGQNLRSITSSAPVLGEKKRPSPAEAAFGHELPGAFSSSRSISGREGRKLDDGQRSPGTDPSASTKK